MNATDFADPGFYEYLLLMIGVFCIILAIFLIGVMVHIQHYNIRQEIADEYGLTLDQVQYKIDP
jgi:hypothetical protein